MKRLMAALAILLGLSAAAFGEAIPVGDVTIVFSPTYAVYPPGEGTATCQIYGAAPCVDFFGAITDNDTDGSFLYLTGITFSAYADYFTVDNTFTQDLAIPGAYEGDALDSPFPNSYSGVIMGLDIAAGTPVGAYTADAIFAGFGGDGDPDDDGFSVEVPLTVIVTTPEPATGGMTSLAGMLAVAAVRRRRRTC